MRRIVKSLAALAAAIAVLAAVAGFLHHRYTGPGPTAKATVVVIARGAGLRGIADQLDSAGVIADRYTFILGARLSGAARGLKAGEYAVPAHASMAGIVALLRSGEVVLHRLTVPEGLTSRQIVTLIRADPVLSGTVDRVPAEGSLLPETYYFPRGETRAALLARMHKAQGAALDRLWPKRAKDLPLTRAQAVVLASMIEKETALPSERPRVAAVFLNRLARGMRLESDPTVVYALTDGAGSLGRPLSRADLQTANPYNTYRYAGLPPGPIANPGIASLRAALHPATTDALYFVADGTGGHAFARTLAEHHANVARWRARKSGTAH
jgi:UPF0755 protein